MPHMLGERLMLREYREEDFGAIRRWVNDPEATRYLSHAFLAPHTALGTEKFMQSILSGQREGYFFVIADRNTQEYYGQIDIFQVDAVSRCGEIGIVVAPWVWHRGYAREALGLIERYAFEQLNFHRLWLDVFAENVRARAAYRAAGFVEEGVLREHIFKDGAYRDLIRMGILCREWVGCVCIPDANA